MENLQGLLKCYGEKSKLSEKTGISTDNISDWFNPDKNAQPSADALVKIADHFGCSVDYLLDRTDVKELNVKPTIIYKLPVYQQDVAAGAGQLGFDQKHEMKEFCEVDVQNKISYGKKLKVLA